MISIRPHFRVAFVAVALVTGVITLRTSAAGKPGYPDKVLWDGVTWSVKTSTAAVGPGPNIFSKSNVWADAAGLHLSIAKNASGKWTCAEIIGPATYGYGTYTFTLGSRVDTLDPNVVLGLFTWSDRPQYAHRELDIELARWGNAADPTNAQYVVQPYDAANHLVRFVQPPDTTSVHRFTWKKGQVDWDSVGASGGLISSTRYTGSDVPVTGDERVRLNLWLFNGAAPTNGQPVEVVIQSFSFTP
ncbi:MAG TPA: hypothetical protein VM032_08590 [Vicinamibacterales bacterium]|nr:hypothetical protein [Vicinamibacterales bacterium]